MRSHRQSYNNQTHAVSHSPLTVRMIHFSVPTALPTEDNTISLPVLPALPGTVEQFRVAMTCSASGCNRAALIDGV